MLAALLMGFLFFHQPYAADHHASKDIEHTVVIEYLDSDYGWGIEGSGVAIKTPHGLAILTASHVATDVRVNPLRACSYSDIDSCVPLTEYIHEKSIDDEDWSFFPVSYLPNGITPTQIRTTEVLPGETIVHIGAPFAEPWISVGNIAHIYSNVLMCNLNIAPGSSGGPVFDDTGKLIGIVIAHRMDTDRVLGSRASQYWRAIIVPVSVMDFTLEN